MLWVILYIFSFKHKINEINQLKSGGTSGGFFKLCMIYKRERNQSSDHDHFFELSGSFCTQCYIKKVTLWSYAFCVTCFKSLMTLGVFFPNIKFNKRNSWSVTGIIYCSRKLVSIYSSTFHHKICVSLTTSRKASKCTISGATSWLIVYCPGLLLSSSSKYGWKCVLTLCWKSTSFVHILHTT